MGRDVDMAEESAQRSKAKTGDRKRKGASEKPRRVMAFRVNDDLYARLEAAAQDRGFSLSEEIEARLTESCQSAPDPFIGAALRMAAANCAVIQGMLGGRNIAEDAFVRAACAKAAASAIELVGGLAGRDAPGTRELLQSDADAFGAVVAMFTDAMRQGVKNDFTEGVGIFAELAAMRRNHAVELQEAMRDAADRHARGSELARALREGAPADVDARLATPDEIAGMVDAPGLLPPEIGDRAAFDEAAAELPLVRAEKAVAGSRPKRFQLNLKGRKPAKPAKASAER